MAAKDYVFQKGMSCVYLTKQLKNKNGIMSSDRRVVTDNEIIALFEVFLKNYCEKNKTDFVNITDTSGNLIFTASADKALLDK